MCLARWVLSEAIPEWRTSEYYAVGSLIRYEERVWERLSNGADQVGQNPAENPTDWTDVGGARQYGLIDGRTTETSRHYAHNELVIFNDTTQTDSVDELWFIQTAHEVPSGRTNRQQRDLLDLDATRVLKEGELDETTQQVQVFAVTSADTSSIDDEANNCLLYTSPSPRDRQKSRMPSSA